MSEARFQVVFCSVASEGEAAEIARALVERRLAACVQVIASIRSTYRWQGRIVEEGESLLLIKSEAAQFEALREAIRDLHSYDTPEIVALDIAAGDADYLAWLGAGLS